MESEQTIRGAHTRSETVLLRRVGLEIRTANELLRRTEAIVIEQSKEINGELMVGIQNFDRISQFLGDLEVFVTLLSKRVSADVLMEDAFEDRWRKLAKIDNWVTCHTPQGPSDDVELF